MHVDDRIGVVRVEVRDAVALRHRREAFATWRGGTARTTASNVAVSPFEQAQGDTAPAVRRRSPSTAVERWTASSRAAAAAARCASGTFENPKRAAAGVAQKRRLQHEDRVGGARRDRTAR